MAAIPKKAATTTRTSQTRRPPLARKRLARGSGRVRTSVSSSPPASSPQPVAGELTLKDRLQAMMDANQTPAKAKEVKKKKSKRASDPSNFLAKYFRDMSALSVLKPEEEFSAAREIEQLEIAVWQRLFSYAPMVDLVLSVTETCMENALAESRGLRRAAATMRKNATKANEAKMTKAGRVCAEKLQVLDKDKNYLEAVFGELFRVERDVPGRITKQRVTCATSKRPFRDYMARVRRSNRAASDARNDFVRANLRLVVSIARRFNHGRMALADLIQEGNIGLMKAVERYDYSRGFRFSTYASWWIRHAISRALADKGREVRLPVHMIDAQHRLAKAKRGLSAKLGRDPNTEELAEATNLSPEKIEKMRTYLFDQSFSLDRPVNDDDGRHFIDFLQDPKFEECAPADKLAMEATTREVRRLLRDLKPIEADILRQRFGLDDDRELTLKEIGAKYNLSRERIRQLQEQALTKMRRALARIDMM